MIQSFGSGLGHAGSTWKRGTSSASAGMATMAATSDEKNNLTASSLRWLRTALWRGAVLCPLRGPRSRRYSPDLGPRQSIGQSRTVALWHADVKLLLAPAWTRLERYAGCNDMAYKQCRARASGVGLAHENQDALCLPPGRLGARRQRYCGALPASLPEPRGE